MVLRARVVVATPAGEENLRIMPSRRQSLMPRPGAGPSTLPRKRFSAEIDAQILCRIERTFDTLVGMRVDLAAHDVTSLDLDELESGICSFAARLAAATAIFLVAVGEYDRRRGWETWECRNMVHWLTWKCGTSPVTAREQVRVSDALGRLPLVREHFCRGELSYSQVRAITRVATEATEADLVDLAHNMTAAQLEVVVRAYRRAQPLDDDAATARHNKRRVTWSYDDAGMVVGTFCLPPEEGAMVVAALDATVTSQDVDAAEADGASDPYGAARADALVRIAGDALDRIDDPAEEHSDRHLVTILVDQATLESAEHGESNDRPLTEAAGATCQVGDGPGLAPGTVRRLACDQPTVTVTEDGAGHVLDVGRRTRRITRPLRRALARRDGHCRFPGCSVRRTQAHHIRHWVDGGPTSLANLVRTMFSPPPPPP